MKIETKDDESITGFMFGLILLGPAVGKLKYTLMDKQDITLLQNHQFEAFVDIDRNGQGAHVYAFAFDVSKGKKFGRFVQDILWEIHFGGIAPGYKVVHRNGISVDNRLENLSLSPMGNSQNQYISQKCNEPSLYWAAVEKMPHEAEVLYINLFSPQEEIFLQKNERYYECHYPPCSKIEARPQEFSICSLCRVTRYCSSFCQAKDWRWHKPTCITRPRPILKDEPDR
ncbi:zinc finger MYND domain-containing protein 19 isoform X2 [Parasteatoda tepidariorum]|uniref:zinc finger MYND domain-containing protein 19 isoform X1 n=1 Tax=Parasteatoda tepidariorum TaxID=114398 RepID=UPI000A2C07F5|nr:zinc finger MYND domain-containing protein 19 isoform X1 [Parasteatoda tepidariorum]XP_042898281.1 zinc finger MYND domain-containing protein 19 isoform X2 [Parasteatoda tepidariorum]